MKTLTKLILLALSLAVLTSCGQPKDNAKMAAEKQQKELEQKMIAANDALFAAWNSGDEAIFKANTSPDFTRKNNGGQTSDNQEGYIGLMKFFRTAIPDLSFTHELMAVKGNKTYTKWTATGTNDGMFGDQPATGKSSTSHGFTILTFNDEGVATHEEAYLDQLSYLEAWGYTLVPPTEDSTMD